MCAATDVKTGLDVLRAGAAKAPSPGNPGKLKQTITGRPSGTADVKPTCRDAAVANA